MRSAKASRLTGMLSSPPTPTAWLRQQIFLQRQHFLRRDALISKLAEPRIDAGRSAGAAGEQLLDAAAAPAPRPCVRRRQGQALDLAAQDLLGIVKA